MKKGTLSLLIGVHQFIIHPVTVWIAWYKLYGLPGWRETICIIMHDWGYWGKRNMDDSAGETHPELAAKIAGFLFGEKYRNLCLYHSRHYARKYNVEPSPLCWADKLSITYERWYTYLPRAWISGELKEYRQSAAKAGFVPMTSSNREWYCNVCEKFRTLGLEKRGDAIPYVNPLDVSKGINTTHKWLKVGNVVYWKLSKQYHTITRIEGGIIYLTPGSDYPYPEDDEFTNKPEELFESEVEVTE